MNKLAQYITGHNSERCSGRTTALAIGYISCAMRRPGDKVIVTDHACGRAANERCYHRAQHIAERLELKFLQFRESDLSITFEI